VSSVDYLILSYLLLGALLNIWGPLSRKIWLQKVALASEDVPLLKRVLFLLVLRFGVLLFYPLFLIDIRD
jgi:hypothetical protein